jgi:hypothetical protein
MNLHLIIIRKKKAERYFVTSSWWKALKFWIKNININVPKIKVIRYKN